MTNPSFDAPARPTGVALLAIMFLVAVGYFVAGRLGQLLAVPPSYATAVWPASAVAFVACFLWGNRVAPGVLFGAWLVNAWTPFLQATDLSLALHELVISFSISVGATIQAVLAATLVRHQTGPSNALIHDRQILYFLLLSGPVACLAGATWGVSTLALSGAISGVGIAINWWTWWVGDVLGVAIFSPLLMILLARPRTVWRPRVMSCLPTFSQLCLQPWMISNHVGAWHCDVFRRWIDLWFTRTYPTIFLSATPREKGFERCEGERTSGTCQRHRHQGNDSRAWPHSLR